MREICLDTETTGLDPRDGHKIIEIACVELINKVKTGKVFHSYINPRRDVPNEAFRIHGISTEFLQDKPIFDHIAYKFLDFIRGAKLVIHNAAFDMKFINFELRNLNIDMIKSSEVIDSLLIARTKFPGGQNSLDALCKRFDIDLSKRKKHGALLDAELLSDVYIELMGGAQTGMFFEKVTNANNVSSPQINNIAKNDSDDFSKKIIPSRNFKPSEADLENHKKFILKNFKNNLWYNDEALS